MLSLGYYSHRYMMFILALITPLSSLTNVISFTVILPNALPERVYDRSQTESMHVTELTRFMSFGRSGENKRVYVQYETKRAEKRGHDAAFRGLKQPSTRSASDATKLRGSHYWHFV